MYRACGQFWSIFAGGRRKGKTYGAAKCGNHDTSAGNPRKRCEGAGNRYQNRVRSHTEKQAAFKPDLSSKYRKSLEEIKRDTERDHYMTAQEALEYGLIDQILEKRG